MKKILFVLILLSWTFSQGFAQDTTPNASPKIDTVITKVNILDVDSTEFQIKIITRFDDGRKIVETSPTLDRATSIDFIRNQVRELRKRKNRVTEKLQEIRSGLKSQIDEYVSLLQILKEDVPDEKD